MSESVERPSNCQYCGYACAVIATVEEGRVTRLRPDPARYPYGASVMASCKRWPMNVGALDAPDRVNYPLRWTTSPRGFRRSPRSTVLPPWPAPSAARIARFGRSTDS